MRRQDQNIIDCKNMILLGYRDYISARFLLNNEFLIQGITLASTAVERYLKAIMYITGHESRIHLGKWKEIKNLLKLKNINVFDKLDEEFIKLLSKVYQLRYYDQIQNEVSYGFLKLQVLAELDYTINLIESGINIKTNPGGKWSSRYNQDLENKYINLFQDNYILNKLDKKEFMERKCKFVSVKINKNRSELMIDGFIQDDEYTGSIIVAIPFTTPFDSL